MTRANLSPPPFSRAILRLLAPRSERNAIDGDLREEFAHEVATRGNRTARAAYRAKVVGSFWSFLTFDLSVSLLPRLILGVMIGVLVPSLLSFVTGVLLEIFGDANYRSVSIALLHTGIVVCLAPIGGFVASRVAGSVSLAPALLVAAMFVVPAVMTLVSPGPVPGWVLGIWILSTPIAITYGGVLSRGR